MYVRLDSLARIYKNTETYTHDSDRPLYSIVFDHHLDGDSSNSLEEAFVVADAYVLKYPLKQNK